MSRTPLFLIAAPIGNFVEDMPPASLEAVRGVRHLLVEADDTILLRKLREKGVVTDDHVLHVLTDRHNPEAARLLAEGVPVAMLANTGLPCFVDPGWDVVRWVLDHGLERVELVPLGMGSALDAALCMCGLELRQFAFLGHYPTTHTLDDDLVHSGLPLFFYVSGTHVRTFLAEVALRVRDVERVVLLGNIRRRSGARALVVRGPSLTPPEDVQEEARANWMAVVVREGAAWRRTRRPPPHATEAT